MSNYKRIRSDEREIITQLVSKGLGPTAIGEALGRNKSSISRELKPFRLCGKKYSAFVAQHSAEVLSKKHHCFTKIESHLPLRNFIEQKLSIKWSPQQISMNLKEQYKDDPSMQISHESIYTYIYLLPRGELRQRLIKGLRQSKRTRKRRIRINKERGKILDMISIDERPAEVAGRSIAGHWEGDLLMGKDHQSALGSIVERKTRSVILVPLKGGDATTVRKAFEQELKTLPAQMRQSMTYDQGKEMAQHKLFTANTQIKVFFCHPRSPWERGTNENTNMLIRDFFPKGTDFNTISKKQIKYVQHLLNTRPRKTLSWKTPGDVFEKEILDKSG